MSDPDERLGSVGSCKRGDVGSTNDAYAEAYLGDAAALQADAITVHPFLGLGAMDAFVSRAAESGSCLLVVARSSNPAGREVQAATTSAGWSVEAELLGRIAGLNERLAPGEIGPIGAVVWPTHLDPALDLVRSNCLFLAPGVGAQGVTPRDVQQVFAACKERVMPSASRSPLAHPDPGPCSGTQGSAPARPPRGSKGRSPH
jgi:orotidine-5'-phosphate decarboxylase